MCKKIVFYLTQRGLCSELITLVYSIAFTKIKNVPITVDCHSWNSYYSQGWSDYFNYNNLFETEKRDCLVFGEKFKSNPFLNSKEFLNYLYIIHSVKTEGHLTPKKGIAKYIRPFFIYCMEIFTKDNDCVQLLGNELNHHQLKSSLYWKKILDLSSHDQIVSVGGENILLSELLASISRDLWKLKKEIKNNPLEGREYVSLHIRRGDKLINEAKIVSVDAFIKTIEQRKWNLKPIFISSDDYSVILELQEKRPQWEIVTFTKENRIGHQQSVFNKRSKEEIFRETKDFLNEINIHIEASFFVGSITSNVTKLISMIRNDRKTTFSVDKISSNLYNSFFQFYE
jgi:hypothetical protein